MVSVSLLKSLIIGNPLDHIFQLLNTITLFLQLLDVFPKLTGLEDRFHLSQLLKSPSTLVCFVRFFPFRESSRAVRVVALGISTSNGRPFLRVI